MINQTADSTDTGPGEGSSRRRWLIVLGLTLTGVLLVLLGLPQALRSKTIRGRILQSTLEQVPGELQVDRVDAGWFRPTRARGIELRNQEGSSLLEVESVVSDRSLPQLIAEPQRLGEVRVLRPRVLWDVDTFGQASNWSRFLDALPWSESSGATPSQAFALVPRVSASVEQGELFVTLAKDRQFQWTDVNGRFQHSESKPHLLNVALDGVLPPQTLDTLLANAPVDTRPRPPVASNGGEAERNQDWFPMRLQFQLDAESPASISWRANVDAPELSTHVVGVPLLGLKARLASHESDRLEAQLECRLADGAVSGQGELRRNTEGWRFVAMQTLVWRDARLSPSTARRVLQYVAPQMAEAGELAGRFDLRLSEVELMIGSPESLQATGTLQLHSGDIRLSPLLQVIEHVLVRIYASLHSPGDTAPYEELAVTFDSQEIHFEVTDRRVDHERICFRVGEARAETTGAVGFDGSLDLRVSVWIPESWVATVDTLRPIAGEPLEFRIRGTLQQPEIDESEIVQLIEQVGTLVLLENAAEQLEGTFLDAFGF